MSWNNVGELADILNANSDCWLSFIHKTSSPDALANDAVDLSMAAGTPKYNAYVGDQLAFTPLSGSGNTGIYTGQAAAGKSKYLTHWWMHTMGTTNNLSTVFLMDYCGFYPMIDCDSTDQQDMDNTLSLTRYTDGAGLRIMLVATVPGISTGDITISYTNQAGTTGRSITCSLGAASYVGDIVSGVAATYAAGKRGIFMPLAEGDTGVRSVQSVTLSASVGGFQALVLVKHLARLILPETYTVSEKDFLRDDGRVIPIYDDAYLNMAFTSSRNITPSVWRGGLTIVRR